MLELKPKQTTHTNRNPSKPSPEKTEGVNGRERTGILRPSDWSVPDFGTEFDRNRPFVHLYIFFLPSMLYFLTLLLFQGAGVK